MSSRSERSRSARDWLAGSLLLASSLLLLWIYAGGQLVHTVRFLFDFLVYLDQIMKS